jgi:NAD kinase
METEYAIVIKNKTRLELLIERFNTRSQAQFYIERSGGNWDDYEAEHEKFCTSLNAIQKQLSPVIKNKIVERSFLPSFIFSEKQLVIVVGQDGLVANTAKYVDGLPMIAVNPDTDRYDGILLPFHCENFLSAVRQVMKSDYAFRTTTLAEAKLNDGQRLLAFNDLYVGASSHVSSRYRIMYSNRSEEQSSSGIIISTQSGSSGWLSSVFNMANGMNSFCKTNTKQLKSKLPDDQLMFVVREPFLSKRSEAGIVAGLVSGHARLSIESYMPANGVIFSDGVESDFLQFNSGAIATIGTAREKAKIVLPA